MKVFIDVGCNRGQYSFGWVNNIEGIKVFAFEPNPELFAFLKQHESEKFKVFDYAIGTEEGVKKFNIGENDATSSLKNFDKDYTALSYSKTIDVNVIRLDTFCKSNDINEIFHIKIDAQGSDLDVLNSMGDYLHKTKNIMVEAFIDNDKNVYEDEVKENQVINLLLPLGFELTNRAIDGNYSDLTFEKK
jgi:FkbM family methyltransferase